MNAREPMWRRYLRLLGPDVKGDVNDELAFHLDSLVAELRAGGMSEREAREVARTRFGDPEALRRQLTRWGESRVRHTARVEWWGGLVADTRLALRRMRLEPGFTAAVVAVLALGIGSTTAMFSAVDAAMLRPLPFFRPDRLLVARGVSVPFKFPGFSPPTTGARLPNSDDVAALHDVFSRVAAYAAGGLNLSDERDPVRVSAGVVTAGFFETLGVLPSVGRTFTPAEGVPAGPDVTIISDGLWRRRFGGREVLGQVLPLNGKAYTIIGVMPRGFGFPDRSDLWIPLTVPATMATFEPFRGFLPSTVIGRVADGVAIATASAHLSTLWEQLAAAPGDSMRTRYALQSLNQIRSGGAGVPLQRMLVGNQRTALLVLLGATGLLLLIACANVTSLLLSRSAVRRREVAVRAVLGATRHRVARQFLTESVLLALAGAAMGLAVAPVVLALIGALLPGPLSGVAPPRLDFRVLGFATTVAMLTGVAFGVWPALGAARVGVSEAVKGGGGRGATPGGASRGRRALVAAELALTTVLLIGAGLMLQSFQRLLGTEAGFRSDHVATLELSFAGGSHTAERARVIGAVIERLEHQPGIQAAGVVNDLPLRGAEGISIAVKADGQPEPTGDHTFARYLIASGGYFDALHIPLIRGRLFTAQDDSAAPHVAVISETMARTYWPGVDPIGRTFNNGGRIVGSSAPSPGFTVVGIVADIREDALDTEPWSQLYYSALAMTPKNVAVVARGTMPEADMLRALRDAVRAADPAQAVFDARMLGDVVGASVAPRRTNTLLIAAFAGVALLLAVLGVYGVVAFSVAHRTRELGIRVALGATGADLVSLVVGEMVIVVVVGLALGLAGAVGASRVLETMLYGISARDAATFALAPVALALAALVAALLPARRSLRLNPMEVIRAE